MGKEKELREEVLDQVAGGVQAGTILKKEWWDEFGNHYIEDSSGNVHMYRPDGTEVNKNEPAKKKTSFL